MFEEIFDQLALFEGMDASQRDLLKSYFFVCECNDEEVIFAQAVFLVGQLLLAVVSIHLEPPVLLRQKCCMCAELI